MIPLYILGLLLRFGPQHGYNIKKLMEEQVEDFTLIKLPTVYYHLEKMETAGYITARHDQDGLRPEKTVYEVSESGVAKFKELLKQTLNINYRPLFDVDAAFYFSDHLETNDLTDSLSQYIEKLNKSLSVIQHHQIETIQYLPESIKTSANIIFHHHIAHYQAEIAWAKQSIDKLKEAATDDKATNH
jgi:DNA-binding PadR family transcriptional regulator